MSTTTTEADFTITRAEIAARNPAAAAWTIDAADVAHQLADLARGLINFRLTPAGDEAAITWADAYCGHVDLQLGTGWTITVFNDCGDWDYVDAARAPDGREQDDWHTGDSVGWFDPSCMLSPPIYRQLLARIRAWPVPI